MEIKFSLHPETKEKSIHIPAKASDVSVFPNTNHTTILIVLVGRVELDFASLIEQSSCISAMHCNYQGPNQNLYITIDKGIPFYLTGLNKIRK